MCRSHIFAPRNTAALSHHDRQTDPGRRADRNNDVALAERRAIPVAASSPVDQPRKYSVNRPHRSDRARPASRRRKRNRLCSSPRHARGDQQMNTRLVSRTIAMTAIAAVFYAGIQVKAGGQTPAGSVAIPRTTDGRPDLSGVWQVMNTAAWNIQDHAARRTCRPATASSRATRSLPAVGGWRSRRRTSTNRATADPEAKCYLPGVPRITYMPYPFQIVQTPTTCRCCSTSTCTRSATSTSTAAASDGHIDWWMGDSRGRWEGDTLVVDVVALQRRDLVRPRRQLPQRRAARRRALHAGRSGSPRTTKSTIEDPKVSRGHGR